MSIIDGIALQCVKEAAGLVRVEKCCLDNLIAKMYCNAILLINIRPVLVGAAFEVLNEK
ncbi:MAG TPA: hypothetical protein VIF37_01700 [Methylobacter sp.]|jgi:hypothetical protein